MLREALLCVLLTAAVLLSGCLVQAANPLFMPDEDKTESGLEGEWETQALDGSESTFYFQRLSFEDPARDYMLLFVTGRDGKRISFECRVCRINGIQYLDLQQSANLSSPVDPSTPHWIMRCEPAADYNWILSLLDAQKLYDYLREHPAALQHEASFEDGTLTWLLLTASTAELRSFFGSAAAGQCFTEGIEITYTYEGGPAPDSAGGGTTG